VPLLLKLVPAGSGEEEAEAVRILVLKRIVRVETEHNKTARERRAGRKVWRR
jgi:hypothetical protein